MLTKIAIALVATYVAYYTVEETLPIVSAAVDSLIDEIRYSGKTLDRVSKSTKGAAVAIETDHTRKHKDVIIYGIINFTNSYVLTYFQLSETNSLINFILATYNSNFPHTKRRVVQCLNCN